MWTRVLMRLMADFARETFEINMGLLAALEGQGSASKGMWGHKSYVMRFSWLTLLLIPLKIRSEGRSASKGKGVRGQVQCQEVPGRLCSSYLGKYRFVGRAKEH